MKPLPLIILMAVALCATSLGAEITSDGARLTQILDRTGVDKLWPAGVHISWETGVPDGKPEDAEGKHTHCSAFVAAIAKKLGIYILRPPEHPQALLANAQYDWLADHGQLAGWTEVTGAEKAQELANRGEFVVATYRNHLDNKPGHIAIVRPSVQSPSDIEAHGPQITQAGGVNYLNTTLEQGFASHPAAWGRKEVRYYAHLIDWSRME